ncbi:MAG: hypothetical protein KDD82_14805, partial [Planctomycetes bacterium]|nr:hypothetical protein [Planctomycetota bacterium]
GAPVLRLVDQSQVRVRLHVRPGEALWLHTGAEAVVRIPSLRTTVGGDAPTNERRGPAAYTAEGVVEGVSAVSDPQTQKVAVDVTLDNPGALRAGLFARVELDGGAVDDAVWIPDTAVVPGEDGASLYLVEGEVARRVPASFGARLGEGRLLRSDPADWGPPPWELVVDGTALLFDGAPVRRLE